MLAIIWLTSSLLTYFTPKSSTTRVIEIGRNSWYHKPGVLTCSKYPNGASLRQNLLLARMSAWGKPQTAVCFFKWAFPLYAKFFIFYCLNQFREEQQRHLHVLEIPKACRQVKFLMLMHIYLASGMLMMLFQWSLVMSKLAVQKDGLDSYLTRFPPDVIWILFGSSFLQPIINNWIAVSDFFLSQHMFNFIM